MIQLAITFIVVGTLSVVLGIVVVNTHSGAASHSDGSAFVRTTAERFDARMLGVSVVATGVYLAALGAALARQTSSGVATATVASWLTILLGITFGCLAGLRATRRRAESDRLRLDSKIGATPELRSALEPKVFEAVAIDRLRRSDYHQVECALVAVRAVTLRALAAGFGDGTSRSAQELFASVIYRACPPEAIIGADGPGRYLVLVSIDESAIAALAADIEEQLIERPIGDSGLRLNASVRSAATDRHGYSYDALRAAVTAGAES